MTGDAIRCDTEGCSSELRLRGDMTADQADAIARYEGWLVTVGARRSYHHCPKCRRTA